MLTFAQLAKCVDEMDRQLSLLPRDLLPCFDSFEGSHDDIGDDFGVKGLFDLRNAFDKGPAHLLSVGPVRGRTTRLA